MLSLLDIGHAWRSLRRSPGFTIAAALTLALGIGTSSAIFTILDAVLLRPLPYSESDRLVGISHAAPGMNIPSAPNSLGTYLMYRRANRVLDGIGAYQAYAVNVANPHGRSEPERVGEGLITASVLSVLRVRPLLGRGITELEDRPGAEPVALVGEGLWRRRFGADPRVVGSTIQVDGKARQVVGVMPASFRFPQSDTQIWLPLALDATDTYSGGFSYEAVGRLRAGVSLRVAEAELQGVLARLPQAYPNMAPGLATASFFESAKLRVVLRPMRDEIVGDFGRVLLVIAGTAGLVLLVACVNVASLLLVRSESRQKELAVRTALGASRLRLLAHFLGEGVVLAALGGAFGMVLATIAIRSLVRAGPSEIPRLSEVGVDGAVFAFTALLALGVAVLCSALPALRYGAASLTSTLKEGGRSGTAGRTRQRARGILVSAQVALALVLLAASGLLTRSAWRLRAVRPGFDPTHVLTLWLSLPRATYPHASDEARFYTQLTDRVRDLPGVRAAGVVSKLPLVQSEGVNLVPVYLEDTPLPANALAPVFELVTASDGYFGAMTIPLVAGRTFGRAAAGQEAREVVVSRTFAERFWKDPHGTRAIGKRLKAMPTGQWQTIVGVVEGVRDTSLMARPAELVYFPAVAVADSVFPHIRETMGLVVRTAAEPRSVATAVEREIHSLDATLPLFNVRPLEDVVARSTARVSFTLLVLAASAIVALVLGAVGLYGVIAYVVSLRTREIGLRIALGAQPASVSRLVARQGVALAAAGVAVGVAAFSLLAGFLRALLFEVSPTDPATLAGVSAILLAVAAVASWLPARRAARIDPAQALRAD